MDKFKKFCKFHQQEIALGAITLGVGFVIGACLGARLVIHGSDIESLNLLLDPETGEKTFQAITTNGVMSFFEGEPTILEVEA